MSKYLRKTPEQLAQEMLAISQALELMNKEEAEALGTISKRYVDSISEPKKAEAYLKFLDQYATKEEKKRLKNRINILKKLAKQDDTDSKQLVVDDKNANKIQPASHQTMALDRQIVKESGINYNNIELTHYLKTKKRDSPTRVLDSNETNHQRLASILERLQR